MTAYWIMFIFPALLAFAPTNVTCNVGRLSWGGVVILLILIIGLRYEVGGDWAPYWTKFVDAKDVDFADAIIYFRDPGYWLFNWLFANSGLEIWSLNLLCATLSVSGIVAIAKRQPQPWIALTVAVPYILMVVSMGYVRQSAALGLVCWALLAVQDRQQWRFLLFAVLAATFHKSAVVVLPLFLFTLPRIKLRHWIMLGFMISVVFGILVLETLEAQWYSYVEKEKESSGALIRVAMNLPPALLLLLWKRKLGLDGENERHWYWFAWISLLCLFIVSYASTAVDRLALYLLPLQMVVYARAYKLFNTPVVRSAVSVAVILLYAVVMFVWLTYAKHAEDWLPYQFYPFVGLF